MGYGMVAMVYIALVALAIGSLYFGFHDQVATYVAASLVVVAIINKDEKVNQK